MSTEQVIDNYICNHCILPSRLSGGDTTKIIKISETQYGLYLLDVAGHGQAITNAVNQIKQLIEELANTIFDPATLVNQLNLLLHEKKLCKYLTLLYGVLNIKNNTFAYTIAGHYPNPILLDNRQYTKYLPGNGVPLGILATYTFTTFSRSLDINDTIVLFSDGIIKSIMLHLDIEARVNYLLELTSNHKAELTRITEQLKNSPEHDNIKDDVIIVTIKRTK